MSLRSVAKPCGLFAGNNIMTPTILGYYKIAKGYAELSEGTGISRQSIFGVTIRPGEAGESKMFYSRSAAESYIEELAEPS